MSRLRVHCLSVSIDGLAAGPRQSLQDPMGVGGMALHGWVFPTRTFRRLHAGMGLGGNGSEGTAGIDDGYVARGFENVGAWIVGRNMFGPVRGAWGDGAWRGWWGEEPPFRVPVFVLTHHARPPAEMAGGTTFHFVTGGIREALGRAVEAAGARDVRLGGGAATIRQYLAERLVDEMHLAVGDALLGSGEALLAGLDLPALGYAVRRVERGEGATHVVIARAG